MAGLRRKQPQFTGSKHWAAHGWTYDRLATVLVVVAVLAWATRSAVFTTKVPFRELQQQVIFQRVNEIPESIILKLDAIIVLGGGAPKSIENPPQYTKTRCDYAAQVVRKRLDLNVRVGDDSSVLNHGWGTPQESTTHLPVLCLSAGTAHVPQLLSKDGLPVWESTSSAAYLQSQYNVTNLFVETTSYDTIGNAFYTRVTHTDINGWRNLLIITSEFHMARTKAIFDWIFLLVEPSMGYELSYIASPNTGLSDDAIGARRIKEQESLQMVQKYAHSQRTLKDVYRFLTANHALYTTKKLIDRAKADPTLASKALIVKSYGGGSR